MSKINYFSNTISRLFVKILVYISGTVFKNRTSTIIFLHLMLSAVKKRFENRDHKQNAQTLFDIWGPCQIKGHCNLFIIWF